MLISDNGVLFIFAVQFHIMVNTLTDPGQSV